MHKEDCIQSTLVKATFNYRWIIVAIGALGLFFYRPRADLKLNDDFIFKSHFNLLTGANCIKAVELSYLIKTIFIG